MSLLEVKDLQVTFRQDGRRIEAVKGVSFTVAKGETVALVGESGSGKSVTALSAVGLLGDNAEVAGSITYGGRQMVGVSEGELRKVRGNEISFIFQEPMTSLNPLHTIDRGLRAGAGDRTSDQGRHPRPRKPPWRLSAPAFGRAAPAGDDRHGPCQRTRPSGRRRTHHRAGRDDPGADP
jgi:microcin C transport system ATP-binding protein